MVNKLFERLKDKIENTPMDRLDALKESICISELHPQVKEACLNDIDYRQNMMAYAGEALVSESENISLD